MWAATHHRHSISYFFRYRNNRTVEFWAIESIRDQSLAVTVFPFIITRNWSSNLLMNPSELLFISIKFAVKTLTTVRLCTNTCCRILRLTNHVWHWSKPICHKQLPPSLTWMWGYAGVGLPRIAIESLPSSVQSKRAQVTINSYIVSYLPISNVHTTHYRSG